MARKDILIDLGLSALFAWLRDEEIDSKARRSILKVFRMIAQRFADDADFASVAKAVWTKGDAA